VTRERSEEEQFKEWIARRDEEGRGKKGGDEKRLKVGKRKWMDEEGRKRIAYDRSLVGRGDVAVTEGEKV